MPHQLPPPTNWQDFEDLCCDLWKRIWNDPGAQRFGAGGESQFGVDVFGRPGAGSEWAGVQCKLRDQLKGRRLTEKQIRDEVENAEGFNPRLASFVIATTAPRSGKVQQAAMALSKSQLAKGSFPVDVFAWEDILLALDDHPELKEKHFPGFVGSGTADLREEYLQGLWARLLPLRSVGVVDRGSEKEILLWEVYTALDTETEVALPGGEEGSGAQASPKLFFESALPRDVEHLDGILRQDLAKAKERGLELPDSRRRSLTALETAAACHRLVLVGDPGGGKSTFARYLALSLAGEALGHPGGNLRRLHGLPDDQALPSSAELSWPHGALLPVFVELREFVESKRFPDAGSEGESDDLVRFLAPGGSDAQEGFERWFRRELRGGGVLLVLDGLDEIPQEKGNRDRLKEVIASFCRRYESCRILITSRPYAYEPGSRWRLDKLGFEETRLAPFAEEKIRIFVEGWYGRLASRKQMTSGQASRRAGRLYRDITSTGYLRPLAERPLMLTMMADLHADGAGRFEGGRAALYENSVGLLLDRWNRARGMGTEEVDEAEGAKRRSVADLFGMEFPQIRQALEELAYTVHKERGAGTETAAEIRGGELFEALDGRRDRDRQPEVSEGQIIDYLHQRSGILLAGSPNRFAFPHRSYQEYLAACELARTNFPKKLIEEVKGEPELWREVFLLAANRVMDTPFTLWALLDALVPKPPADGLRRGDPRFFLAFLALEAILEADGVRDIQEQDAPKLERIRQWVETGVERGALSVRDRARAGRGLARLGDTRPGIGLGEDGLPAIEWVEIAAGIFSMGSGANEPDRFGDETPRHEVELAAFRISRYPVTNAQYRAFVADGGYTKKWRRCWTKAGWAWKGKREGPDDGLEESYLLDNHPRVSVSWYEAWAFARWLGEHRKLEVSLPTEAQWERAARGPKGWRYPWGDEFEADRCNNSDAGLRSTTAVGSFPRGQSVEGVDDLSGNVWEWSRSKWRADYKSSPNEDPEGETSRVLRGGSFANARQFVRCAYRVRYDPDFRGWFVGFRLSAPI